MIRRPIRLVLTLLAGLVPAACGVIYTSPSVRPEGAGFDVQVVDVSRETLPLVNRVSYSPRQLPLYFRQVATSGSTENVALPDQPELPEIVASPVKLSLPPEPSIGPYRIGVGDMLRLSVKRNDSTQEQLSNIFEAQDGRDIYMVRDDGRVSIAGLAPVVVAGLTVLEAEDALFEALISEQIEPVFSLEVAQYNSQRVVVGGAVTRSGVVPISANTLHLSEALAVTGGVTVRDEEFGVIRLYRDSVLYQIPFEAYLASAEIQRTILQNGDAVYVDVSYDLDRALEFYRQNIETLALRTETREQALRELVAEIDIRRDHLNERRQLFELRETYDANPRDFIYVTGEVTEQVRFQLPYGEQVSLADVLFENGGVPVVTADVAQIYVLRLRDSDQPQLIAWHLDAENAAMMQLASAMILQPNDVIFVEEQVITKWSRALAQTLPVLFNAVAVSILR